MIEGWHRSRGASDRRRWRCADASPQLSWRRAGSGWCRASCRVISQPAGPPRPRRQVPDTGRSAPLRTTSGTANDLGHAHY